MNRSPFLPLIVMLLSAGTAGAGTVPVSVPDASGVKIITRSEHPIIRLAAPVSWRAWSESARYFADRSDAASSPDAEQGRIEKRMHSSAIRFTENRGQIADTEGKPRPEILYTADAQGVRLYFTARGVSYAFHRAEPAQPRVSEATGKEMSGDRGMRDHWSVDCGLESVPSLTSVYRMDMLFEGANPQPRVHAEELQQGITHYYYAHCPDGITYVKSYGKIVYEDLYDNIDLVYRASQGRMKYEFIVHPGGDPADIRLRYSGATDMQLDAHGALTIETTLGTVQEEAPYSYQGNRPVLSSFAMNGNVLRFSVDEYDTAKELVIDPWATYCGGSGNENFYRCACDANGNCYVAGIATGQNFPVLNGIQTTNAGGVDFVFVAYNSSGVMQWSTYYGGSSDEGTLSMNICVDGAGNSVFCGNTTSYDFPVTAGAFQTANSGFTDGCIVKLTSTGTRQWATYYGGSSGDDPRDVAMYPNGNIVIVGSTSSPNFPVLNAFQPALAANADACIIQLTPGGQLVWATYFGGANGGPGTSPGDHGMAVALLPDGSIAVAGTTQSLDFPVLNAFQNARAGSYADAFLARFSSSGSLLWSTYFGGTGGEMVFDVCADGSGNIVFVGGTVSHGLGTPGAFQVLTNAGSNRPDGLIVKFSSTGSRIWCSYFGGSDWDNLYSIEVDANNTLFVSGSTSSTDMPVLNAFQPISGGGGDWCCASFSENCSLLWSTYFGGSGRDTKAGMALGLGGDVVMCGDTESGNMPVLNAQQSTPAGNVDGFILSLGHDGYFPVSFASLAASADDGQVLLYWQTESESDNAGFIIERFMQAESGAWEQRGYVAGAGSSHASHEYSFTDALPAALPPCTELRYRLRQIDTDGSETVSQVVTVQTGRVPSGFMLTVHPNPAIEKAWVELHLPAEQNVDLALYDRLGRRLRTLHGAAFIAAGTHVIAIDLVGLPSGAYYLRAQGEGRSAATRILVHQR